jgi:superfamily II DNA or RNA helicase
MTLRDYQVPHAKNLLRSVSAHGSAFDGSDTGTGKTFVALHLAKTLGVTPLVICPKSVTATWRDVAQKMGVDVFAVGYEKSRGACRYDAEGRRHTISELGFEKPCGNGSQWRWTKDFEFAIFDEGHRCGGMTTLPSKQLIGARRQFGSLLILSATAADDARRMKALGYALGLFDLADFKWWMLKHGITPGIHGGFDLADDPDEVDRAMVKIHHDIFPAHGSRLRKGDIAEFPKTQLSVKLLDDPTGRAARLSEEIRDAYRRRAAQAFEAEGALAQMRERQALELLKVPDLVSLAEDYAQTSKVVIFVNFRETLAALADKLPFDHVATIHGDTDEAERFRIQQAFQANEIPVLVVMSQAGGTGMSLHDPTGTVERTALISPGWCPVTLRQVTGRVHRDGGAFSQQLFVFFESGAEADAARSTDRKLDRLDLLNDADLIGEIYA